MDFSQIFSNMQNNKLSSDQSFEDKVTLKTQAVDSKEALQNNTSQNNMLEKLLPLLAGGKNFDANSLVQMFASSNPQMSGLMSLIPMLKNMQTVPSKKQSKKKFEYVKISDYYKK